MAGRNQHYTQQDADLASDYRLTLQHACIAYRGARVQLWARPGDLSTRCLAIVLPFKPLTTV